MEAKIYKIINSEYENHFEILLEVNGIAFQCQSVHTKQQILVKFNITHENFNILAGIKN